ncbi:HAD superfamily hydrolase (TIGR01458 family) [Methylohalomonas lacus]|uniref:Haloacid dehalogenase-like hydrolase domain-containing protein 2 n=1 Tax=Methylohalomonas lacus TaxID=398773 RepID=A0AAE3HJB3_9GAMM|nr:TIGR01458 family HAD-type hydrolase [Methylohalomonas lacus]MCS3902238.1 HAD superfamily hydrolase (TIGR01458 family) [Methylohalomonas lacus]
MHAVLCDLDGVVYQDGRLIDGAAATLEWLHEHTIDCLFVTNTSSKPRQAVHAQLADMGLQVDAETILTPAVAACHWLHERALDNLALFVPVATREDFADFTAAEADARVVIVGDLGEDWNYRRLNHAFRLLQDNPQCSLLALGMTRYWRSAAGLSLDTGPFVRALEFACGRTATVLGKPATDFFKTALEKLGVTAEQALMVGDDIRGDIAGAQQAGLKAALVQTGKFRPEDLQGETRPDAVLGSIAELPDWWERNATA